MTKLTPRWQTYFANIANAVSKGSKDPSTKNGAVIFRPDKTIASTGFNGLPACIEDTDENLNDRSRKYSRIVHAEMNSIYHAREKLNGYGMFATGKPCAACALGIIANGITTVYHFPPSPEFEQRWQAEMALAKTLFDEAGVEVFEIPVPNA